MPQFTCSHCGKDITERAKAVLGEESQFYMPYALRVLCPHCSLLTLFKLEYQIALTGAKPVKEPGNASPRNAL